MAEDVKQRILDAAAQLFMEKGFSATTVRELGERAGVGQSSLYHHARSKADVLVDLQDRFTDELLSRFENSLASSSSPSEQLLDMMRVLLAIIETHQAEVTIFLREGHALPPEFAERVRRKRDQVDQMMDQVLRRGMKTGEFRSVDVKLTRLAVFGMCNWAYQWMRPGSGLDGAAIARHFFSIVIEGIGAPPPAREAGASRRRAAAAR